MANESGVQNKMVENSGKGYFSDFCKIKEAIAICENSPWMQDPELESYGRTVLGIRTSLLLKS